MQTRQELYELVTPLAGLGIWERNLETGGTYWNSIVREIFEVAPDYTASLDEVLQFYHHPRYVLMLIEEVVATGQPKVAQMEIVTGNGNRKWIRLRMHSLFKDGVCWFLYGTMEDITQQLHLMRIVQEREQQLEMAFRFAPIGMAFVSLQGEWIKVNQSLCQLLGHPEASLLGHSFQEFTHPDDLQQDRLKMQELTHGRIETYSLEKRYFHKDGHIMWALVNVSLLRTNSGEPLYFIAQIKDNTDRRRDVETIRAQNSRLLNFAHIVSHNLRSHTGNIKMLTDMIMRERDTVEQKKQISMLSDTAETLLDTLAELNDVVQIHDNGLEHRKRLNVVQAVKCVLVSLSAYIQESNANMELLVPEDIYVLFNPAYLESVFVNLISNTIKYRHPDRSPHITITGIQTTEQVIIKIKDNGRGIDMPLHGHKLFGMYKTFHGNKDARGIGLFLTKNQVEAMGGKIYAESQPGIGSCFTIEINRI